MRRIYLKVHSLQANKYRRQRARNNSTAASNSPKVTVYTTTADTNSFYQICLRCNETDLLQVCVWNQENS